MKQTQKPFKGLKLAHWSGKYLIDILLQGMSEQILRGTLSIFLGGWLVAVENLSNKNNFYMQPNMKRCIREGNVPTENAFECCFFKILFDILETDTSKVTSIF